MTQTFQPDSSRVLEIRADEIDDFEEQVAKFQAGEWDPTQFMAFRLRQGIYGQRQPDVHMVRVKAPFGGLTADQLDALGEVAQKFAPLGKGHVTTRENIQFHHVLLSDGAPLLRILGEVGLSTREACGNTVRNVTGCPSAGVCSDEPFDVTPYAAAYSRYFVRHPFSQAMPRKIKSAFSGCLADCAITAIHDVGFLPVIKDGEHGFKMVMGGGTSIMARIAPTLYEFVSVNDYLKVTEAALRVFHKSNELRKNRSKARVKFLIDRIGIDEFRNLVEEELSKPWAQRSFDPRDLLFMEDEQSTAPSNNDTWLPEDKNNPDFTEWKSSNVSKQKQNGYNMVSAKLPLGDIQADQFHQLADIARKFSGGHARATHQQNLVFRWVPDNALFSIWNELSNIGLGDSGSETIKDIVSCPGTDSCKMGITSSMGLARAISEAVEMVTSDDELTSKMHVKMSGCPNGCGQHHIADIGFHGAALKGPGGQIPAYDLFIGGTYGDGETKIGQRVKARIPTKMLPEATQKILSYYQSSRLPDEEFKDFVERIGTDPFAELLEEYKDLPELSRESIEFYMDWDKTIKYQVERGEGECMV